MSQEEEDKIATGFIKCFIGYCKNVEGIKAKKVLKS